MHVVSAHRRRQKLTEKGGGRREAKLRFQNHQEQGKLRTFWPYGYFTARDKNVRRIPLTFCGQLLFCGRRRARASSFAFPLFPLSMRDKTALERAKMQRCSFNARSLTSCLALLSRSRPSFPSFLSWARRRQRRRQWHHDLPSSAPRARSNKEGRDALLIT